MFKGMFGKSATTKPDVAIAVGGAIMAVWKAVDTFNKYKAEQAETEKEIEK